MIVQSIETMISDIKHISQKQSINNTKYRKFYAIETRRNIQNANWVFNLALSFVKLINRLCYIRDNSIVDTLFSGKDQVYKSLCVITKILMQQYAQIEGIAYELAVAKCIDCCTDKLNNAKWIWLLNTIKKSLLSNGKISIDDELHSCLFYMVDCQMILKNIRGIHSDIIKIVDTLLASDDLLNLYKIHLKRIYLIIDFFEVEQNDITKTHDNEIECLNMSSIKEKVIKDIKDPVFFNDWMLEISNRMLTNGKYYYFVFLMPFKLQYLFKEKFSYYYELCYEGKPEATGNQSEKYFCVACGKIINISLQNELEGKYLALIKHCEKCWRSHGVLINVRFGRLLVVTPFNVYEINLPYYNIQGMNIASYLEDSTTLIDIDTIHEYTINSKEAKEILQICISGDDINNTNVIRGGGYIEVYNFLEENDNV